MGVRGKKGFSEGRFGMKRRVKDRLIGIRAAEPPERSKYARD